MNEIRKDYILNRYVIISTERAKRPGVFQENRESLDRDGCPFCPNNDGSTPNPIKKIPGDDWQLKLIPNKFPALSEDNQNREERKELFNNQKAHGFHEILIETPEHAKKLHELTKEKIRMYLDILAKRYKKLKSRDTISYVSVFKNKGQRAGASINHAHSQLVASPVIPEEITRLIDKGKEYYEENGRCPYCTIIENEQNENKRIVAETKEFLIVAPYAPVWSHETWIIPKRHISEINELRDNEKKGLAGIMKKLLKKYHDLFGDLPYNLMYFSFPKECYTHFHVVIRPKLKDSGGFEEFGLYINEVSPEESAEDLQIDL